VLAARTVLVMDETTGTEGTGVESVLLARARMNAARASLELAALEYRQQVAAVVARWRAEGVSLRKSAERLGISDGALRDLLRPPGASRRGS